MASTVSDGGDAADRYRRAQRGLTRLLVRDMGRLRRFLNPVRLAAAFPDWLAAADEVVAQYGEMSATLAAEFFDGQREAAGVPGSFTAPLADRPPPEQVETSLRWAMHGIWQPADEATVALDVRLEEAERQAEAVAQKLVADQGRETVRKAAREDRQAVGFARAAALGACAFCRLMASRGMVYKTAETAGRDANERFSGDASVAKFHNNCVPAGTLVDGPTAEIGYRRWYEGEMLVISTAAGHKLSITPNHPVLTDCGWLPAGLIRPGDYVLSSLQAQGSSLDVPHEEHVPSRIEDVWSALSVLGLVSVPVSPEHFHGDGANGKVDVVRADSLLRRYFEGVASQVPTEDFFARPGMRKSALPALGSDEQLFGWNLATARRLVGGFGQAAPFFGCHPGEPVVLGGAPVPQLNLGFREHAADGVTVRLEAFGERELALTVPVRGGDLIHRKGAPSGSRRDPSLLEFTRDDRRRHAANALDFDEGFAADVQIDRAVKFSAHGSVEARRFDPSGLYSSVDGRNAYASLGRDLGERLSGRVERDRIVEVCRTEFAGHVYNLQTTQGWYRADGVIVSNCHCAIIPVFRGQRFELSAHAAEWDRIYREYAQGHPGDQLRRFRRALAENGPNPLP